MNICVKSFILIAHFYLKNIIGNLLMHFDDILIEMVEIRNLMLVTTT